MTDKTVRQFGASWQIHDHLEDYFEQQFLDWVAPLGRDDFRDRVVLDAGCGKGRHSRVIAKWGASHLLALDLSSAIYLTAKNTRSQPAVHCVQANLLDLPFSDQLFDVVLCVGVLHHLRDPERALQGFWRALKPGGAICLWVYAREGNGWIVYLVDPIRRGVTSRIPTPILRLFTYPLALVLYAVLKLAYRPTRRWRWAQWLLPYQPYLSYVSEFPYHEIEHIVLDQLCPPIAHYLSREQLERWCAKLGAESVTLRWHNRNSWNVLIRKGATNGNSPPVGSADDVTECDE